MIYFSVPESKECNVIFKSLFYFSSSLIWNRYLCGGLRLARGKQQQGIQGVPWPSEDGSLGSLNCLVLEGEHLTPGELSMQ